MLVTPAPQKQKSDYTLINVYPQCYQIYQSIVVHKRSCLGPRRGLAEAEIALRLTGHPYHYLNGSTSLHTRTEVGILVVGVLLCVYGNLQLLDRYPVKQAMVYGFLKEAGFNWQHGQLKAALNSLMAPHADPVVCSGGTIR